MNKVPLLKLDQLESVNSWIMNMDIRYDTLSKNEMSNTEQLIYYSNLYLCKTHLAGREIVFTMSDTDLTKLHEDTSDILHINLVPSNDGSTIPSNDGSTIPANDGSTIQAEKKSKISSPKHSGSNSPKRNHRIISPKSNLHQSLKTLPEPKDKIPRLYRSESSLKTVVAKADVSVPNSPKRKRSSSTKIISRSKTADDQHLTKILTSSIMIDNIIYAINYKTNQATYNVFKIEKVLDNIFCSGVHDFCVTSRFLIENNYESKDFVYENTKYEIVYTKPINDFKLPMFIGDYNNKITAVDFISLLPHILDGFCF